MRIYWLVILWAAACKSGSGQSFHDGVQALCDLPAHVPDTGESYEVRLAAAGKCAEANVTNSDVGGAMIQP